MPQPEGLWFADRMNPNFPGGFERVPAEGGFRTKSQTIDAAREIDAQGEQQ